jgi:hypothetical protein
MPIVSILLRKKSTPKLSKSPNREQVAVVAIIEVKGAVEASNMFLLGKLA